MDKSAIKTYAVEARRNLMEAVRQKAYGLYMVADGALPPDEARHRLWADGIFLSPEQSNARLRFCNELAALGRTLDTGAAYQHMIEEVAYTWFNRLIALRFMEVNDYLPSGIRILSGREPGRVEPDAMREVERLDYVKQETVAQLRAETGFNAAEKLYRYILISQCNALSDILPGMFQKANDYTELLLPDALLAKGGVVHTLVNSIHEDNFNLKKQGQIEIIGWLYQYYISEKKDRVFANLKKNIKINRDTIPAATQLFTPAWIVKYMVENSLGRLWLERTAAQGNDVSGAGLRKKWKYYVDEAEQEPAVREQLMKLRGNTVRRPEDIKLIDPCMGSGHILVYAFDVLFQIYQSEGYAERDIPSLILQNNLYGLDIDDRAGQLAYFALMMKARSYNRRFFRRENMPQPMVCSPKGEAELAEFGSLVKADELEEKPEWTQAPAHLGLEDDKKRSTRNFRCLLAQKYHVVVTNPPYMTPAPLQADWIKKNYPDSKSDLCVVFIERSFDLLKTNGYLSMITMHSWMFLSSYEKFRKKLIASRGIVNMAHLGARAFEEIGGEVVQTTAFVARSSNIPGYLATYVRLVAYNSQQAKEDAFLRERDRYDAGQGNFQRIPGCPVAYWVSKSILGCFDNPRIGDKYTAKFGMSVGDGERFIRLWHEISLCDITFAAKSMTDYLRTNLTWNVLDKGGPYRKWYGNRNTVVLWKDDGQQIRKHPGSAVRSPQYFFMPHISWTLISATSFSARFFEEGFILDTASNCLYKNQIDLEWGLGLLNSRIAETIFPTINPTLNMSCGVLAGLPYAPVIEENPTITALVRGNIDISRTDWDSFEASWDFKRHPLINGEKCISDAFDKWKKECESRFDTLKANETELNRIFVDIYGLQDELTPEVEDRDVTVRCADLGRDIRSFLSYAVGCMFGRYSLDRPGLAFAGGSFDMAKYKTFLPADDNIIPIGSDDYFDDDIVVRFSAFVRAVYSENTLGENLSFIADALYPNGNGTAQERIRRYFLNDFYKDHVKSYQKRPIYWLMSGGKKDGFKALFYLHRYDKYTIARARTDYLHPLQRKYDAEIKRLELLSAQTESAREKAAYRKEADALRTKIDECRIYDQVVSHIAHQKIELDLDDGVRVNYAKFQGVEVPTDNDKLEKMDLLGRI